MVEYEIKSGPQGHYYIPRVLRETWGVKWKIIPSRFAGVVFPSDALLDNVLGSLKVLVLEVENQIKSNEREVK